MTNEFKIKNNLKYYSLYINGEWIRSNSNKFIAVENPATEEIIGYVTDANQDDVDAALVSSQQAQLKWQELTILERADYLKRLGEALGEEREHFARLLTLEQGKTYTEALFEVQDTINYITQAIEGAKRIKTEILPVMARDESLIINRVPYGVTLGLCAWNYPLALVGRKLGPALLTGNTIIIKPHELTPIATTEFFRIIDKVGFPKGVINLITCSGFEMGQYMVKSPIVRLSNVTGSVGAGQAIYKASSQNISGLILELGGKSPFIVMEDADLDKAVEAAVISRYSNCGQVCICCDMIFAHEKIAEEFTKKLLKRIEQIKIGNPFAPTTTMGPKMCKSDLEKIDSIVQKTISEGAILLCGGKRPKGKEFEKGYWYEPTVLGNVTPEMTAAKDEIFGPVLPIIKIKSFDHAAEIANALPYGLSAYLFTENYRTLIKAQKVLEVGTIFMNKCIVGYTHGFHSGHKLSGLSGEDGEYGLEAYMQKKVCYIKY